MALFTANVLSLCSGYGGLELGFALAGFETRTICYVEREAYAAANLAALMQTGRVAEAPLWSDLTTFDGHPWRGSVDILTAGFPCQPHSLAGKRRGTTDTRWIFEDLARIVRECRPSLLFFENVPGLRTSGLAQALQRLASLGYDATWLSRKASDAGAPHKRDRLFVMAHDNRIDIRQQPWWQCGASRSRETFAQLFGEDMGDNPQQLRLVDGEAMGNTDSEGPQGRIQSPEQCPDKVFAWPPGPEGVEQWKEYIQQGGPEPAVRRSADGSTSRVDRLRLLGNGVCPQQAGLAIVELTHRLKEEA